MGRRSERAWSSKEAAEVKARQVLGDTYEVLSWASGRSPSLRRVRDEATKDLERLSVLHLKAKDILSALKEIEDALGELKLEFSESPGLIDGIKAASTATRSPAKVLHQWTAKAKATAAYCQERGGYVVPWPPKFSQPDFLVAALGRIHFEPPAEIPTDPNLNAPAHLLRKRLIDEAHRGVLLNATGWVYAAIALGIEEPCRDAKEFGRRYRNNWYPEIHRFLERLRENGIREVNGRARFVGVPTAAAKVPTVTSSSSGITQSPREQQERRTRTKRRTQASPRR